MKIRVDSNPLKYSDPISHNPKQFQFYSLVVLLTRWRCFFFCDVCAGLRDRTRISSQLKSSRLAGEKLNWGEDSRDEKPWCKKMKIVVWDINNFCFKTSNRHKIVIFPSRQHRLLDKRENMCCEARAEKFFEYLIKKEKKIAQLQSSESFISSSVSLVLVAWEQSSKSEKSTENSLVSPQPERI